MTSSSAPLARLARTRGAAVLLALGLLFANLALTFHHYDLAAHRGLDDCAICTVASHLGHGLAAASTSLLAPSPGTVVATVPTPAVPVRHRLRPAARAPPSLTTC